MIASQASSSPASRAPEADGRLCMDLKVDNGACPGWSWEGDARMASPTRLEVRSRAEGSPEGSGASCPVPGDAVAPAGSRGSFWSRSGCSSWRRLPGNRPSLPRTLHVVPGSRRLSSRLTLCLGGADPQRGCSILAEWFYKVLYPDLEPG